MAKLNESQLRDRARLAAVESAPKNGVGDFLTQIEEDENVYTFLFAAKMKGYLGWAWSVSLFADEEQLFSGRTPIQMYQDYMQAFADAMGPLLGSTIVNVEVSMGPAGEMRYPSYPSSRWLVCQCDLMI